MKHELLSPVGNMECLYQAMHNGADAVYLGMKNFGARAFSKNFTESEIEKAISLCHLYSVKIYVTMNTLIRDNEVNDFFSQVEYLYKLGVDALIMQDVGMIYLVRKMYPNLEIHASTQANNSSLKTIKMFYDMGVKRVVLSRELSLNEIKKIDIPIELEVFIHGALCISYSGCCLMSSMIGNRSGNRGECTGCCRLPYDLYDNSKKIISDKYLLSTKELNTSHHIDELLNSNIKSFKIEGRMKSPMYVGFITKFYRYLLDNVLFDLEKEEEKLKILFNRKFTSGHLFNQNNIMNINTPNHIGLKIGKVVEIKNNKIKIKLDYPLFQEDGIRFLESGKGFIVNYLYDSKGKLVNSSNDIVLVDNKVDLKTYDTVYKTQDRLLNKELENYPLRRINLDINFTAKKDKPIILILKTDDEEISLIGNTASGAKTSPIDLERVEKQLSKLGNSNYRLRNINIDMDKDIFIPIKELNELRRNAVDALSNIRMKKENEIVKEDITFESINVKKSSGLSATCYTKEQVDTCIQLGFQRIYVIDREVYNNYLDNENVFYYEERNQFNNKEQHKRALLSEYQNINSDGTYIGNYTLNVTNIYTLYYLFKMGFDNVCLSVELTKEEIIDLLNNFKTKFGIEITPEVIVYGRVCNMMIKGNILGIEDDYFRYQIKDKKNRFFPVYMKNNNTYILNYQKTKINLGNDYSYIKRFEFFDEGEDEIIEIVKKYT